MKSRLLLVEGALIALAALLLVLGRADTVHADFNPELDVTVEDPSGGANSNFTTSFNLPEGDVNFGGLVLFLPGEWDITPGDEIPIGAIVGDLTASATLGLINGACDNDILVEFTFLNASIDPSDTVPFEDTDERDADGYGTEDYAEDKDGSGIQDAFEKYPDFITRALADENGDPLQPLRRSAGIQIVAGTNVLLQFLIFEPGTFIDENIPNDEELGYPTVTLLQNAGDEEAVATPGPITDFCTPLTSTNVTYGVTLDNACTDEATPPDELDPVCEVTTAPLDIVEDAGTEPNEGGLTLFGNPPEGDYEFTVIGAGLRDADGDGYENSLDTCPFDPNIGDPRVGGDGDQDQDGMDAACDSDDTVTDSDVDLDGYLNRQDNCPMDANGEDQDNQRDSDTDQIGDACDPNPDDADAQGELIVEDFTFPVTIGPGVDGGDGDGDGDGDQVIEDGDDDDDGGSAVIFIIIGVVAAVVVVGGGAFFLMRGRGGGGTPA